MRFKEYLHEITAPIGQIVFNKIDGSAFSPLLHTAWESYNKIKILEICSLYEKKFKEKFSDNEKKLLLIYMGIR